MPSPASPPDSAPAPEENARRPGEEDDFERRLDFRALRALNRIYGIAFHQLHQHNPCPVPRQGPALIAANHTAGLDPVVIQAACPRPIVWVMTREYYDLPRLRWFFEWTRMVPIDVKGRDSRAWREAMRHLEQGRVVGVFPEGRIERSRELMPFQTGVALLAIRGGADLYPVFLDGLQRRTRMLHGFLAPRHPSIAWGEPLPARRIGPDRHRLTRLTAALTGRIEDLRRRYPAPRVRGQTPLR